MSSSRKKVVVRRFSRDWIAGFVDPQNLLTGSGTEARLDLLDQQGRLSSLPLNEVKMVSFVRDFSAAEPNSTLQNGPEKLARRTFNVRPRTEGLWLRMTFRDNDVLEGIAANDLSLLDMQGVQITPPDMRSNTQRVYVPRLALTELHVLAVIGVAGSGRRKSAPADPDASLDLFNDMPSNARPN